MDNFNWRTHQQIFIRECLSPLLQGDFAAVAKFYRRTPQEKHFAVSDESGLSAALLDLERRTLPTETDYLLNDVRYRIAFSDLCARNNIPITYVRGEARCVITTLDGEPLHKTPAQFAHEWRSDFQDLLRERNVRLS